MHNNIYPIFDTILSTNDKEKLLNQRSIVIWMLGLSGSGKSTLARSLEAEIHNLGFMTQLLDGDNLRTGINSNLTFTEEDRDENIRRTSEVAKLFVDAGIVTICSFITPIEKQRQVARRIIGDKYFEVYIKCPVEVCEERDVKGLYKKARSGEIPNFTGISAPFEDPINADITVDTSKDSIEKCHHYIYENIFDNICFNQ